MMNMILTTINGDDPFEILIKKTLSKSISGYRTIRIENKVLLILNPSFIL